MKWKMHLNNNYLVWAFFCVSVDRTVKTDRKVGRKGSEWVSEWVGEWVRVKMTRPNDFHFTLFSQPSHGNTNTIYRHICEQIKILQTNSTRITKQKLLVYAKKLRPLIYSSMGGGEGRGPEQVGQLALLYPPHGIFCSPVAQTLHIE